MLFEGLFCKEGSRGQARTTPEKDLPLVWD
jgi:hypothetical protein